MKIFDFLSLRTDNETPPPRCRRASDSLYDNMSSFNEISIGSRKKLQQQQQHNQQQGSAVPLCILPSLQRTLNDEIDHHYDVLMTFKSIKSQHKASPLPPPPSARAYSINTYSPVPSLPSEYASHSADRYSIKDGLKSTKSNVFCVIKDYQADFKDDLSVNKGDLVYLIDKIQMNSTPAKIPSIIKGLYDNVFSGSSSGSGDENKECDDAVYVNQLNIGRRAGREGTEHPNEDWIYVRLLKRKKRVVDMLMTRDTPVAVAVAVDKQSLQGFIPRTHVVRV
jgi:hypothetical protein